MGRQNMVVAAWLIVAALVAGCLGPASTSIDGEKSAQPTTPKRIVAAILGDPVVLASVAEIGGAGVPGTGDINNLMHLGLTGASPVAPNGRRAILAEDAPTFENSLWKVLPDGRMEVTWKLREAAKWHDGTPLTSADLLFTSQVVRNRELLSFRSQLHELIDRVDAADAHTVVIHFRNPHIDANLLFGDSSKPLPKHLLERAYLERIETFMQLPYWGQEFVGSGPFKLREWVPGSHVTVDANPDFVLGRPKVDTVEVRFIPDAQTFMANFLAGAVELSFSRGLNADQGMELGAQWRHGKVNFWRTNSAYQIYPQFMDSNPAVIGADVRFRRALLHAIDRQQLVDTFFAGMSSVAHAYVTPGQPGYEDIERSVMRYDYDPRRARQLLEEIGYRPDADGMYRDAAGQPLALELRNFGPGDNATHTVGDYWTRAGVRTTVFIIPQQLSRDNEYRMTFPGLQLLNNPLDVGGMRNLHSRFVALPDNNYAVNNNKSRYSNPQYDEMVDRYFVTIPAPDRLQLLGQLIRHIAQELPTMAVVYNIQPIMMGDRLLNVTVPTIDASETWNPEQWDVR